MSKFKHILLALCILGAAVLCFTACSDNDEDLGGGVNRTVISLSVPVTTADSQTVYLMTRGLDGSVKVNAEIRIQEGDDGWCSFDATTTSYSKSQRVGDKYMEIFVRQNNTDKVRRATIFVALSNGTRQTFTLDQQPASENAAYDRIWGEQPSCQVSDGLIHKTYFTTLFHDLKSQGGSGRQVRNYSVCYDTRRRVSLWVAYPLHTCYTETTAHLDPEVGISERLPYGQEPWTFDPNTQKPYIPKEAMYVMRTYDGYDRGHQIPSADRYSTKATNAMTFYSTNMTPQRGKLLNQKVWARLEGFVRQKMVSDTLFVVTGCHFENDTKTVSMPSATGDGTVRVGVPTHYFKVLLRTRSGRTGKSVMQCSASELQAVGFLFENKDYAKSEQVSAKFMTSVAEIESLTGFNFFRNLPAGVARSVKKQKNPRDWGL